MSIEICKLTLDYLNNGPNRKKYQLAATKYNTTPDILEDAMKALVMLLINSAKSNVSLPSSTVHQLVEFQTEPILIFQVSEEEFINATDTGFNAEQMSILWQFVSSKRNLVSNILKNYGIQEYRFRELDWRLEARIASRSLLSQAIPIITIKLHLDTETTNENKQTIYGIEEKLAVPNEPSVQHRGNRKEVIVQTDPNNLLYIIDVLEMALEESKTHRLRNLVKTL